MRYLQIETTNVCNAKCIFCPHDRLDKFGYMAADLYENILEDASRYEVQTFIPMLTGEPFCDQYLLDRLAMARGYLPQAQIYIFTNGSLIKPKHIQALKALGNVKLNISLNGHNTEKRLELTGLDDFEYVVDVIDQVRQAGIEYEVSTVWYPTYSIRDINSFGTIQRSMAIRFQSFAGLIYPYRRRNPTHCKRAIDSLTVLWTGKVALCCFDMFGSLDIGDMRNEKIFEVMSKPVRKEYINAHQRYKGEALELCRNCTEET